jgi:hypothetical protein
LLYLRHRTNSPNLNTRNSARHFVKHATFIATICFASEAPAQIDWLPTSMDWYCATQSNGETLCSLIAEGPLPASLSEPIVATATYRVLKGRTHGSGAALLTSKVTMSCQKLGSGTLRCGAPDEVKLASGVKIVFGVSPPTTVLNIYADSPTVLFDWDGDGQITAEREGMMLQRYLMGFRGDSVTAGIPLAADKTSQSVNDAIAMGIRNEWFEFIAPGKPLRATQEGAIFNRCTRGLRGADLVSTVKTATAAAATAKCKAIMAIE